MPCEVLHLDPDAPAPEALARAAAVLRRGGLVAFPTETVYGLGADARAAPAVARIFAAKGRPATNPVIVHTADAEAARALAAAWPAVAEALARRFWPGPLTLVLPRAANVPDVVTAGGPTVALRVPAHPVAQALLRAADLPIAAPSANRSTELSPTRAEHVVRSLGNRIDMVLDAGPASGGLESTVLDVTTTPPRLLRPGLVTPAELEAIVGRVLRGDVPVLAEAPARSPGQLERHYAPHTPLELVAAPGAERVTQLTLRGLRVGWLALAPAGIMAASDGVTTRALPAEPKEYAARLYETLHRLDEAGLDRIVVDLPPSTESWLAIHDRLRRAATSSPD